ncbi:MAG TPA: histidine phosphatase family protein [Sporichthyaceae bacterium]|nr:histidine phosphatase family protein [Sporichthyaceae bacterium]
MDVEHGRVVLIRHGETEWSLTGRHTGRTDVPLTAAGEAAARALRTALAGWTPALVVVSPLMRARRTAELAGLSVAGVDARLAEWDYGLVEGRTSAEVNAERAAAGRPDWSLWQEGAPDGESPEQVGARVDSLLAELPGALERGDVALVAHGHVLRVLAARWLGEPVEFGAALMLGPARLCVLGAEHDRSALATWNADRLPWTTSV